MRTINSGKNPENKKSPPSESRDWAPPPPPEKEKDEKVEICFDYFINYNLVLTIISKKRDFLLLHRLKRDNSPTQSRNLRGRSRREKIRLRKRKKTARNGPAQIQSPKIREVEVEGGSRILR